jgi:hypothetical protein
MASRIMASLREEQSAKRGWLQRIWFPQHTAFPVKMLALLVVCVSGYYLSHSVQTDLQLTTQQQLQEMPTQQAPAPTQLPIQEPAKRDTQEQPVIVKPQTHPAPAATPQPAKQQENFPVQTTPQAPTPAPATFAPAPPAFKDQFVGKAESVKTVPAVESANRVQEARPEKKMKSSHRLESNSDAAAPAATGRAAGAPTGMTLPQATVRLSVDNPSTAPAMIREAVFRAGGSIVEEQDAPSHRFKIHIPAARHLELIERLQRLGNVVERTVSPSAGTQLLEVTIQW